MAEFKLSSRGHLYVSNEGLDQMSPVRISFVVVTIIVGFLTLAKLTHHFLQTTRKSSHTTNQKLLNILFLTHFGSYTIHAIHYADNIYRPVAYFEPRWLYVKYVLSEMEITFFVNFPITLIGILGMEGLLTGIGKKDSVTIRRKCKQMIFYIIGSLLTIGHYRIEFPTHFSAFVNFTIGGEGTVTILLALVIWNTWKKFPSSNKNFDDEDSGNLLDASDCDDNLGKEGGVNDGPTTIPRKRSRTPVRS